MLSGKTVLITRAIEPENDPLGALLSQLGANLVHSPVISITAPDNWSSVDLAIEQADRFNSLVFLSASGVSYFLDRLNKTPHFSSIRKKEIVAIGRGTKAALMEHGITPVVVPDKSDSKTLASVLISHRQKSPFLILRGNRGSDVLPAALDQASVPYEQVVVYQSHDNLDPDPNVTTRFQNDTIDWVCVTSSSIAESTVRLYGDRMGNAKFASISPLTTRRLVELGHNTVAEAASPDFQSLVDAIVYWESRKS